MKIIKLLSIVFLTALMACGGSTKKNKLPIMGPKRIVEVEKNGGMVLDTVYHSIKDFSFVDQDSAVVTQDTFNDKIYVADFFFTTCPSICPIMKVQMLRVYDHIQDMDDVVILSHSIDPEYDTVALLKDYAERLGVLNSNKWHFVTGNKEEIYDIGQTSYMVTAMEDETAPGGFLHSGAFILIDKQRRVRGLYDGTVPEKVDQLMVDIVRLRNEYK